MVRKAIVLIAGAIIALLTAACQRVHAEDYHCWSLDGCPRHYRAHRAPVRYYRVPDRYERDRDRDRERNDPRLSADCKAPVRGLGTQWIGTEGALEAAKKDWMERVRYDLGERFVDMSHSSDFESRCGRVSIGEVVGQVTYRCEIVARPCTTDFEAGDTPQQK